MANIIEYKVLSTVRLEANLPALELQLNTLGSQGWGIKSFYITSDNNSVNIVLKRDFFSKNTFKLLGASDLEADNATLVTILNNLGSEGHRLFDVFQLNDANRITFMFIQEEDHRFEYEILAGDTDLAQTITTESGLNTLGQQAWNLLFYYPLSLANRVNYLFGKSYFREILF